jgi:hypothetical protein
MPRFSYSGASERALFRTVVSQRQTKGKRFDVNARILLTAVLLLAAVQLIW